MKNFSFSNARQWLFVGALAFGMNASLTPLTPHAFAQILPGDQDHLKCYEVVQDQNPFGDKEVDLVNKFGVEPNCHVSAKARLFCTPVAKFIEGGDGDDFRGLELETDFTCYRVECPENPIKELVIDDQFGNRHLRIKDARLLCTPTLSVEQD